LFRLTPDVAADTGIHVGDGHLRIKRGGPHGTYQYDVTLNALEDQLYLVGTVMPTIASAYDLHRPGFHINPEMTWISVIYQSKDVALFKHEVLGLPNGRKNNISIPVPILSDDDLMKQFAREILATDGLLGFYTAGRNGLHKYPRIQIKMRTGPLIGQLAHFLRDELGLSVSHRSELVAHDGRSVSHQEILQISNSQDIETWRKEIGFSNPSHISRLMVFETLGECKPRTSVVGRLSFLSGRSAKLVTSAPIAPDDLISVVSTMRKNFGFPRIDGNEILWLINSINNRLGSNLTRNLPKLVEQ